MVHIRSLTARLIMRLAWCSAVVTALMIFSCEEFCEESNRTAVVVGFYSSFDDTPLTGGSFTVKGIGTDSTLYTSAVTQQLLLPVNPSADSVQFAITNGALVPDTITVRYVRHTGFVSAKCGCVVHADIQGEPVCTGNSIVRVVIADASVTTVSYRQGVINAENIRVYY